MAVEIRCQHCGERACLDTPCPNCGQVTATPGPLPGGFTVVPPARPEVPKHVFYIDCDGVLLDVWKLPPSPAAVEVTVAGSELVLTVRAPLNEKAAAFLAQLANALADRRIQAGGGQ